MLEQFQRMFPETLLTVLITHLTSVASLCETWEIFTVHSSAEKQFSFIDTLHFQSAECEILEEVKLRYSQNERKFLSKIDIWNTVESSRCYVDEEVLKGISVKVILGNLLSDGRDVNKKSVNKSLSLHSIRIKKYLRLSQDVWISSKWSRDAMSVSLQ